MNESMVEQLHKKVDEIYRSDSRRVFATLIRLLGDFDLAEDALHNAFAAALEQWPKAGVPANPRAWLVSVGRFKAIDALRRRARSPSGASSRGGWPTCRIRPANPQPSEKIPKLCRAVVDCGPRRTTTLCKPQEVKPTATEGEKKMRFLVMHKSNGRNEAGVPPSKELVEGMGRLMEESARAGVLPAAEGVHPSSKGARLEFSGGSAP